MYRYLCTQRPPMPGAMPMEGLENVKYFDRRMEDFGGHPHVVWGAVEYSRELTDAEVEQYELIFDGVD